MKIISISYNFFTKQLLGLTKDIDIISDAVKEHFVTPLKSTNIGDDKPPEIPRIIGDPKYGFRLIISKQSMQIVCEQVPSSLSDSVILETLSKIVHDVGSFLENYIDQPFNFTGITMRILLGENEIGMNPLLFLIKKMPITNTKNVIENLTFRAAFIENPYYINYTMRNDKQIQVQAPNRFEKPTSILTGQESLIVEFDVNDKYAFLHDKTYYPEIENADLLMKSVKAFYNDKMLDFIKTGNTDHFFNK